MDKLTLLSPSPQPSTMSPRFRHPPKSLEELSLHAVFASVVADLNLAHLMTSDLRHSTLLAPLRLSSPEALRGVVAERLMRLPGILNDQVCVCACVSTYSVFRPSVPPAP